LNLLKFCTCNFTPRNIYLIQNNKHADKIVARVLLKCANDFLCAYIATYVLITTRDHTQDVDIIFFLTFTAVNCAILCLAHRTTCILSYNSQISRKQPQRSNLTQPESDTNNSHSIACSIFVQNLNNCTQLCN
jgi:hypothetical protein